MSEILIVSMLTMIATMLTITSSAGSGISIRASSSIRICFKVSIGMRASITITHGFYWAPL